MRFLTPLLIAIGLMALPSEVSAAAFPAYKYKLTGLTLDSAVAWDHTDTDAQGDPYRAWGAERIVIRQTRSSAASAWSWNVPAAGPLAGIYQFGTPTSAEACDSAWDVRQHKSSAGINIVPKPNGKVLVAFGATIGNDFSALHSLVNQLHDECDGDTLYLSQAVGIGATRSFLQDGIDAGRCEGYTYDCTVVSQATFRKPTVKLKVSGKRTALDTASGVPFTYVFAWTATLKRTSKVK
jgi:hypothetical protein